MALGLGSRALDAGRILGEHGLPVALLGEPLRGLEAAGEIAECLFLCLAELLEENGRLLRVVAAGVDEIFRHVGGIAVHHPTEALLVGLGGEEDVGGVGVAGVDVGDEALVSREALVVAGRRSADIQAGELSGARVATDLAVAKVVAAEGLRVHGHESLQKVLVCGCCE